MAELQRASVRAIVEETSIGVLKAPTSGTDFVPLRPGFSLTSSIDELENDEILNDIGSSKNLTGLERPEGEHPAYLKNSEVAGTAPETALFYKSALGGQTTAAAEYDTVASSTAGTATARAVIKVDTAEGATFSEGEALLIQDGVNGYSIRNVYSISSNDLSLNFNLDAAPAAGVLLGRATLFTPQASNLPSFSVWDYGGNGGYIQAQAGCRTSEIAMSFPTGEQAEVNFNFAGTETFFNPAIVVATNKYIDFEDDGGVVQAVLDEEIFKSPIAFIDHVVSKMDAASVDAITGSYDSETGKFTLTSDGTTFELLWNTGAQAANSAKTILGFNNADKTGATFYTSDNAMNLAAPYTPTYDNATNIVIKGAQLFVGSFSDNVCRPFTNADVNITIEQEDVLSACAASGVSEKLPVRRVATLEATVVLPRYEAHLFDKFINNKDASLMLNAGQKDSAGNWVKTKCVNVFMPQATLTQHDVGGDTVVELTLSARGYISGTKKDIYINYV